MLILTIMDMVVATSALAERNGVMGKHRVGVFLLFHGSLHVRQRKNTPNLHRSALRACSVIGLSRAIVSDFPRIDRSVVPMR